MLFLVFIHQDRGASVLDLLDHLVFDGDSGNFRLQTPFFTAVADDLVIEIGRMAEFAGKARFPVVQVAVDDDSDGDATGEVQVNDVLFGTRASFRIFAVAAGAGVVFDQHPVSEPFFHDLAQRLFARGEIFVAASGFRIHAPGNADSDAEQLRTVYFAVVYEPVDRRSDFVEAFFRVVEDKILLVFQLDDVVVQVGNHHDDLIATHFDAGEIDGRMSQTENVRPASAAGFDLAAVGDDVFGKEFLDQFGDCRDADMQLPGQIRQRTFSFDRHAGDDIAFENVVFLNDSFGLAVFRLIEKFL